MKNREKKIYEVTLIGSICNFILLAFKAVAGFVGNSPAMIADAVHSLTDFVTDIFVILFVKISNKPQDEDHDYGHGKYENLGTTIIGLSLLIVGIFILVDAAKRIYSVTQGVVLPSPGKIALVAALFSIIIKEALYHYTAFWGKKCDSQAVIANAWHHRSDAFSSIATLVGIGGSIILGEKWTVLDPIAALFVSLLIIKVGVNVMRNSLADLMDKSLSPEIETQILEIVNSTDKVYHPHNLRTRKIGSRHSIDLHIRMDDDLTVLESHKATKEIEEKLRALLGDDTIINIHVEPMSAHLK